jgi:hypothetical protein
VGYLLQDLRSWVVGGLGGGKTERSDPSLLQSKTEDGSPIFAKCRADEKPKTTASNRGSTINARPLKRLRHEKEIIYEQYITKSQILSTKLPAMIQQNFDRFSAVDIHDCLCQGSATMEWQWLTHVWWQRLFATIFGT